MPPAIVRAGEGEWPIRDLSERGYGIVPGSRGSLRMRICSLVRGIWRAALRLAAASSIWDSTDLLSQPRDMIPVSYILRYTVPHAPPGISADTCRRTSSGCDATRNVTGAERRDHLCGRHGLWRPACLRIEPQHTEYR